MRYRRLATCFIGLLVLPVICHAQVKDAGLWLQASAKKKLTQSFSVELGQALRWNENVSELGSAFTEIGGSYKLMRRLEASAFYRFGQEREPDNHYSQRHRYYIDLSYKIKFKPLSLVLRERYQSSYNDINRREKGDVAKNYLRSRLTLKYNLEKKYTPYLESEIFYRMDEWVTKVRFRGGVDYELNKFSSIELFYMINKEVQVKNPWTSFITGVSYSYSF
ncbi:MAG: DUF2490 domain-containing protein [Flavobacteriales bacterium]|nr:DUF2490 domain-containing protein [Flavobacteriales bacterium]MCB9448375.1 DUF2490 domain-containing protein [Flavobacteriales bacterium]